MGALQCQQPGKEWRQNWTISQDCRVPRFWHQYSRKIITDYCGSIVIVNYSATLPFLLLLEKRCSSTSCLNNWRWTLYTNLSKIIDVEIDEHNQLILLTRDCHHPSVTKVSWLSLVAASVLARSMISCTNLAAMSRTTASSPAPVARLDTWLWDTDVETVLDKWKVQIKYLAILKP